MRCHRVVGFAVGTGLLAVACAPRRTGGRSVARELVEQGRYAHVGPLSMLRKRDDEAIDRAIELAGLGRFEHRDVDTLSGGERRAPGSFSLWPRTHRCWWSASRPFISTSAPSGRCSNS